MFYKNDRIYQGQKGWGYSFLTEHFAPSAQFIVDFLDATGQKVDLALRKFTTLFRDNAKALSNATVSNSEQASDAQSGQKTKSGENHFRGSEVTKKQAKKDNRSTKSKLRSGELLVGCYILIFSMSSARIIFNP